MAELPEEYVMLVLMVALLLGIPPLRWIYRTYVTLFLKAAQEQVRMSLHMHGLRRYYDSYISPNHSGGAIQEAAQ